LFWRRFTQMQMRGIAAAALASLIGAGFSAQALSPAPAKPEPVPTPTGYEAEDHFPGAANYTAIPDDAAVTPGTTGTIELPTTPVPENAVVDASIQAARPFVLKGTPLDKARALECLTDAIYYEAAREPDDGQRAVAQVVLNRVRHPAFPATVCGVVYQGSEKRGCQFSFACDGSMTRGVARAYWLRTRKIAAAALNGSVFAPVGEATHYHTFSVTPNWNRGLVMTGVFGAHFFHRWKGWWGTAAAFSQVYRGGEPLPEPHPSLDPLPVPAPTPLAVSPIAASTPVPVTPTARAAIQPAYADSGAPTRAYAAPVTADSQVLDRWKDSGKPLR
jgi:spore germination cell wall hydrolase CwlJ-like protein